MAIDFPNSPTTGQIFTVGDKSWIWDGTVWKAYGASLSPTVLKVDSTNTRVGINNQSPAYTLDVTGTAQATQFLQGTDYLTPYQGFRNKIINGGFDIWQRGGTAGYTPTANEIQGADRWVHWWNGTGGTRTISRSTFALGQTAVPDNPKYHMTINTSVLGTSQTVTDFWQRIEGVNTFAGQTATLSFWWKSTSSATQATPFVSQNFGTGGSPSSAVDTFLTTQSLASANTWTKYSVSVSIPSISGKTLGTSSNDFLMVGLRFLISATCTIDIANVQFERGSVATPFEQRPIGAELALCQRYYETVFPSGVASSPYVNMTVTTNGYNEAVFYFKFAVTKRTTAYTVTGYRYDTGAANSWNWNKSGFTGTATPTFDQKSPYGFRGYIGGLGLLFGAVEVFPNWIVSDEF